MSVKDKAEQLRTEVLNYIKDAEAVITRLKNECEVLEVRLAHSESERARLGRVLREKEALISELTKRNNSNLSC